MANKKKEHGQQSDDLSAMRRHSYMRVLSRELPNPPTKLPRTRKQKPATKSRGQRKKRS